MIKRFLAVLRARNLEFVRDRSTLGWNLILPVLLVFGLGAVFSNPNSTLFKVGVLHTELKVEDVPHPFIKTKHIEFITITELDPAVTKVARHQLDMVVDFREEFRYWINDDSRNGYVLEKLLNESDPVGSLSREAVTGDAVRYIDWVVPGILGMNMMFSCLFGVGYVVVRYRKNGFLKRLKATPLHAIEFITAQITSRLLLIMAVTVGVYVGTNIFFDFRMEGSYLALLVIAILGAFSMIAMGFVVASRTSSEELAGGLLNIVSWPMMILSGVWFSLEGSTPLIQQIAKIFPLTQMLDGARIIMLDGGGFREVIPQLLVLVVMSIVFLGLGAGMFRWEKG
ncbi:MAG: ABC transporter permease [Pseudomonadota bacterium]